MQILNGVLIFFCAVTVLFGQDPELVKQAEAGDADAQNKLGNMYYTGEGVPKDDAEAVKWARLAADQGLADAQFGLGLMYENGKGVPEDDKEAVKWFRLAADQGNALAQYNLGILHIGDGGVPEDVVEAYARLNVAAALGISRAGEGKEITVKKMGKKQKAEAQKRSKEIWAALEARKKSDE